MYHDTVKRVGRGHEETYYEVGDYSITVTVGDLDGVPHCEAHHSPQGCLHTIAVEKYLHYNPDQE